jgi:hypothetical protein
VETQRLNLLSQNSKHRVTYGVSYRLLFFFHSNSRENMKNMYIKTYRSFLCATTESKSKKRRILRRTYLLRSTPPQPHFMVFFLSVKIRVA